MSNLRRLRSWTVTHQRWFALASVFSVFSVFALLTGELAWLGNLGFLGFLGFLAPANGSPTTDAAA